MTHDLLAVCNPVWETTLRFARLPTETEIARIGPDGLEDLAVEVVRDGGGSAVNTLCLNPG